jgi:hypothetical protein
MADLGFLLRLLLLLVVVVLLLRFQNENQQPHVDTGPEGFAV